MIEDLKRRRIATACSVALLAVPASVTLLASASAAALTTGSAAARAGGHPQAAAHAARALRATDTAKLHYVSAEGSELLERGKTTGTIPGSMRAQLEIGATI